MKLRDNNESLGFTTLYRFVFGLFALLIVTMPPAALYALYMNARFWFWVLVIGAPTVYLIGIPAKNYMDENFKP